MPQPIWRYAKNLEPGDTVTDHGAIARVEEVLAPSGMTTRIAIQWEDGTSTMVLPHALFQVEVAAA